MKLISSLIIVITLFQSHYSTLSAQGIEFFEGTFEEALETAEKEHKIIFMDAYATWCGPCKRMASEVFTDVVVGEFFNKHFINVKMDMEKGEGPELAQKYRVTSYPTLLFIDHEGEVVNVAKGSRPADQFVALGKATLNSFDMSNDYEEQYEEGNNEPEFLRTYAYSLMMSGKPTLKIANEYIKSQEDLTTPENLEFIFDFTSEADSRIFDLLLDNKAAIIEAQGQEAFNQKVENACNATAQKAIIYGMMDLLDESKKQMKAARPDYAKEYSLKIDIDYYFGLLDHDKLTKAIEKYLKKYAKEDAATHFQYASMVHEFVATENACSRAVNWAKTAYDINPSREYGLLYYDLLITLGRGSEAEEVRMNLPAAVSPKPVHEH